MDVLTGYLSSLFQTVVSPSVRYSGIYLSCTVILAYGIWVMRGRPERFLRWLIPGGVYRHRSNLVDIKLFLANHLLGFAGVFGAVFFAPLVAFSVMNLMAGGEGEAVRPEATLGVNLLATLLIVLTSDFCTYWSHRISHEWKWLWPFHAVHHSANVLTPLTVSRVHPVEILLRKIITSILVGLAQALILYSVVGNVALVTLGGANIAYVIFNVLGSNFRHSHIWVSYGPVLEHIFISPAQHQIHHSSAQEHHDKNYGSIFAIWDWAFGTLYVPRRQEELTFGVTDAKGNLLENPHESLREMFLSPFGDSWAAIRRKLGLSRKAEDPVESRLPQGLSLWLDVLRVGAALTVLFGHMAHIRFTDGDYYGLRTYNLASDAVIVFFVLSGLVIASAARRDGSLERFAFNRLTRVYSVILPALALTLVFDAIGTRADITAYPRAYYGEPSLVQFLLRGLSLSVEWTGILNPLRLGTNGPLWSLSYEVAFYALFAAMVFLRGPLRFGVAILIAGVGGLPVLLLLPAWLFGVCVYHLGMGKLTLSRPMAWALAVLPLLALLALKLAGGDHLLMRLTTDLLAPKDVNGLFRYSDEVLWNTLIALAVALHLFGVWHLTRGRAARVEGRFARALRWMAGASFSLYVVHYPTLHLADALLPAGGTGRHLLLLVITLAVSLAFAALFERPLARWRSLVAPLWARTMRRADQGRAAQPAE